MPGKHKSAKYFKDFIPCGGLPLMIIHVVMIVSFVIVQQLWFPLLYSGIFKNILTGLLNPALLILAFYVASLIYIFSTKRHKIPLRLTLSVLVLGSVGAVYNIYLPEIILPDDYITKFFMSLLGAGLGTLVCVSYRNIFCGKITPLS